MSKVDIIAAIEKTWIFERVTPDAAGASGKVSDLFRNEGVAQRGHLAIGAPSPAATLMAREVIQNSWDAAQELRGDPEYERIPAFYIDFLFKQAEGGEKEDLVDALGLRQLAAQARRVAGTDDEKRKKLGLGTGDCLRDLEERGSIDYCEIVEHGAKGMYGPWSGAKSRMYLAMLSIGYNEKADGSGGTFGYGKAGLIRASHPRVVVAYSCFPEQADDPGVTRRLLGVTYWGRHEDAEGNALSGFARFGDEVTPELVRPFENERADEVAAALGFAVRSAEDVNRLGTTFLVLDPAVEPDELREAVERNWWPALLDEKFTVLITDSSGNERPCRPRKNSELAAYVAAYDVLAVNAAGENQRLHDLGTYKPQGEARRSLGRVALVADPAGWSFPDDSDGSGDVTENRSLVALTRTPRMVVEYHLPGRDISRRTPFVRGLFLADDDVNGHLGRTEPKAHDRWDSQPSDDVDAAAAAFAGVALTRIKDAVREFQNELRPPVDETGAVRLQRLDEKLKRLREPTGPKPPPPPPGERPYTFGFDVARRAENGRLTLSGKVSVELSESAPASAMESRIRLAFAIDEDGRRGDEVPLKVTAPSGFNPIDGDGNRFVGTVTRTPLLFEIESEPYRADWTGELLVSAEVVAEAGE
jgi:hypothetical protein